MEFNLNDYPRMKAVAEQHGLEAAAVAGLVESSGVAPHLAERLLELGTVTYRALNRWGQKTEYQRDITAACEQAAQQGRGR